MKSVYRIFLLCLLFMPLVAYADVEVVLKSGQTVAGTLVFSNDEVVVIKDVEGQRFQYPMSEIESINTDFVPVVEQQQETDSPRKVAIQLRVAGGGAILPHNGGGGMFSVMAHVGANNLFDKRIFVGGGLGYFGTFIGNTINGNQSSDSYAFMPIVARFEAPLFVKKDAPFVGASMGYAFAPKKGYKGGLHAQVDAGWRRQIGVNSALFMGLNLAVQQGSAILVENLEGKDYANLSVQTFCTIGVSLALQF